MPDKLFGFGRQGFLSCFVFLNISSLFSVASTVPAEKSAHGGRSGHTVATPGSRRPLPSAWLLSDCDSVITVRPTWASSGSCWLGSFELPKVRFPFSSDLVDILAPMVVSSRLSASLVAHCFLRANTLHFLSGNS